jgi:hypothetical protein
MYNVWSDNRRKTMAEGLTRLREVAQKRDAIRAHRVDDMVFNYKKRMESFVLQMVEDPIITKDKTNFVLKMREEDPSKCIGPPSFKFTTIKEERDRVREAIKISKQNRTEEYRSASVEFRCRDQNKEIQPEMRFTANSIERMASNIGHLMKSYDENASNNKVEEITPAFLNELHRSPIALKRFIAKNIMPQLHEKIHFKAATSFALALPDILKDKDTEPGTKKGKDDESEIDETAPTTPHGKKSKLSKDESFKPPSNRSRSMPTLKPITKSGSPKGKKGPKSPTKVTVFDPVDLSKGILMKCNVVREKNKNVKQLFRGEGHLASSDQPIKEVEEILYHKFLDSKMATGTTHE